MFNKNRISSLITKDFDVSLPPGLAKHPNLDKAEVKVEEDQIIIQVASETSKLPDLWVYIPKKTQWSVFKFRT